MTTEVLFPEIQRAVPVIIAGGSGSRLWPFSRSRMPKPFLDIDGSGPGLLNTLNRLSALGLDDPPILLCHEQNRFSAAEYMAAAGYKHGRIILEPQRLNTAVPVALAALDLRRRGMDAPLLILPADHLLEDLSAWRSAFSGAMEIADDHGIVVFGIHPQRADSGYGYILPNPDAPPKGLVRVARFIEKPIEELARSLIQDQHALWNSGILLVRPSTIIRELSCYAPDILDHCERALNESWVDLKFVRLPDEGWDRCQALSIDNAVLEYSQQVWCQRVDAPWEDLGDWRRVARQSARLSDCNHNVHRGDVIAVDSSHCYVHAQHRLVATVGLHHHVVIETDDAVLVAHENALEQIKPMAEKMVRDGRSEALEHRCVMRPWGSYEILVAGEGFQVKRLRVQPQARLSLQIHRHRAEHWVVVKGQATVQRGKEIQVLHKDQSAYIPQGQAHRLSNESTEMLEVIEVQSGAYLGEDDIQRLEDHYDRIPR